MYYLRTYYVLVKGNVDKEDILYPGCVLVEDNGICWPAAPRTIRTTTSIHTSEFTAEPNATVDIVAFDR